MKIQGINIPTLKQSMLCQVKNQQNIENKVSFKGNEEEILTSYSINLSPLMNNRVFLIQKQLLEDGFPTEEIRKAELFVDVDMKKGIDLEFLVDHAEELAEKVTGKDLFDRIPKQETDFKAMQKVYLSLKDKFITDDVLAQNERMLEVQRFLATMVNITPNSDKNIREMILHVLHYTNQYNAPVVEALLDDKDFDNVSIQTAIMGIKSKEQAEAAMKVLSLAQETGYDKKFSYPLAIMMSEANPINLPIIEKALQEQDFFLNDENDEFASSRLMSFLRYFDELTLLYLTDDTIGLKEINELMDNEEE